MTSLPSFVCIGAQKAGTSWLYAVLRQHPDIWLPPIKELQFFNHLFVPEHRSWTNWHVRVSAKRAIEQHLQHSSTVDFRYIEYLARFVSERPFTDSWYREIFSFYGIGNRKTGDITPEYSTIPPEGIRYMRGMLGATKVVYILRDPVDRALSQIRMGFERQNVKNPTQKDWINAIQSWDVHNRGDYETYIPRWMEMVPSQDLMFIPYQNLANRPKELIREIERFISVKQFRDYADLTARKHATQPRDVPLQAEEFIQEKMAPQRTAISKYLGEEFFRLC